jgi:hypothetical protein
MGGWRTKTGDRTHTRFRLGQGRVPGSRQRILKRPRGASGLRAHPGARYGGDDARDKLTLQGQLCCARTLELEIHHCSTLSVVSICAKTRRTEVRPSRLGHRRQGNVIQTISSSAKKAKDPVFVLLGSLLPPAHTRDSRTREPSIVAKSHAHRILVPWSPAWKQDPKCTKFFWGEVDNREARRRVFNQDKKIDLWKVS